MKFLEPWHHIARPLEEGRFIFDAAIHVANRGNGRDIAAIVRDTKLVKLEKGVWVVYNPHITEVEQWPVLVCECGLRHVMVSRRIECDCGRIVRIPDWWPIMNCCRCGERNLIGDVFQDEFTCTTCAMRQAIVDVGRVINGRESTGAYS